MQTVPRHQWHGAYDAPDGAWDEAFDDDGAVRPHYEPLVDALGGADLDDLVRAVAARPALARRDVPRRRTATTTFRGRPGPAADRGRRVGAASSAASPSACARSTRSSPTSTASSGSSQAGVVPARVIESAVHYEPGMRGVPVAHGVYAGAAGLDLVRARTGGCTCSRTTCARRRATPTCWPRATCSTSACPTRAPHDRRASRSATSSSGSATRCARRRPRASTTRRSRCSPTAPTNSAWWEHEAIARRLEHPDRHARRPRARAAAACTRASTTAAPVDVLYRRTDEDRLQRRRRPADRARPRRCSSRCARAPSTVFNAFGAGVADDKLDARVRRAR